MHLENVPPYITGTLGKYTSDNFEHPIKAPLPNDVHSGKNALVKTVLIKALLPIIDALGAYIVVILPLT